MLPGSYRAPFPNALHPQIVWLCNGESSGSFRGFHCVSNIWPTHQKRASQLSWLLETSTIFSVGNRPTISILRPLSLRAL